MRMANTYQGDERAHDFLQRIRHLSLLLLRLDEVLHVSLIPLELFLENMSASFIVVQLALRQIFS